MASSIVYFLSKQQKPLTDALKGAVAIAVSPNTTVYESVNKSSGADSGRVVITYPGGSRIGIIQEIGYIGQKLFAKVTLYTYFSHPFKTGSVIKQVLIPIERLLFDAKTIPTNKVELYAMGNNTNIRLTPSTSSKSLELFNRGQLMGSSDGVLVTSPDTVSNYRWYRITTVTGKLGYVRQDVVNSNKPAASPIPIPSGNNKVIPTAEQKNSELDGNVLDTGYASTRKAIYYGMVAVAVVIGFWLINKFADSYRSQ
ncbi:hypothetical protein [Emticicia sp. C21]|uniref:hypothetical protein n=1 Tax=Emticicia sp. C21 TaxID=2302915 RepID=UPI000E3579E1|nr:hypothetical protein [Emticicia sp. C21]RFS16079.1 hypothetical protein D0T08_14415 [Emticicia sp. C21]